MSYLSPDLATLRRADRLAAARSRQLVKPARTGRRKVECFAVPRRGLLQLLVPVRIARLGARS